MNQDILKILIDGAELYSRKTEWDYILTIRLIYLF